MKKIYISRKGEKVSVPQHGYWRRLIRLIFRSFIKRQNGDYRKEVEKISERIKDIEESVEIIAREINRRAERDG